MARKLMKQISVTTDEANPIDIEILAESIEKIANLFEKIKLSRLKHRAIVVLLHDLIGPQHITKKQIEYVLEYGADLKKVFLK